MVKAVKICAVLFGLISALLILLPIILASSFLRWCVWLLSKIFRPDLHSLVEGEHSLFTYGDPSFAPINIMLYIVLDGQLTVQAFQDLCEDQQTFDQRNAQGELQFLKLRQNWVTFLGFPFWKMDPDFQIKNHFRNYNDCKRGEPLLLPEHCTEADILKIAADFTKLRAFQKDRSPWEFFIHNKFIYPQDGDENEAGKPKFRSVLLGRFNHCLGDAYTLLFFLRSLTKSSFSTPMINNFSRLPPNLGLMKKLAKMCSMPWDTAKNIAGALECTKLQRRRTGGRGRDQMLFCCSSFIDVDLVKGIKRHFQVSFTAVIVSVVLGAIRRTIEEDGGVVPDRLGSGAVVPRPNHPGGMAIHISSIACKWSLSQDKSPAERLKAVDSHLGALAGSTAPVMYHHLAVLAQYLPNCCRKLAWDKVTSSGPTFGLTNFPATMTKDYLNDMALLDSFACVSTFSHLDLLIATCGTQNRMRVSFSVSKSLFADPEVPMRLGKHVEAEVQALALESMV